MQKINDSVLLACLEDLQAIAPAGFVAALHIRFHAATLTFRTYPESWTDVYTRNGLVMDDPSVAWGLANTGVRRWSDMQDPGGIFRQAREHGLAFGATCSVVEGQSRSLCGAAHPSRDFDTSEMARLHDGLAQLHFVTAGQGELAPDTADTLQKMSINWQQLQP